MSWNHGADISVDKVPGIVERKRGLSHVLRASGYTMDGIKAAWAHETSFRIEAKLVALLIPVGLYLGAGAVEQVLLVGVLLLVLVAELLNSGIEAVVDRVGLERHPLSKRAKDLGSAAVFLCLLLAGMTWGLILLEHFQA
ncbi:MAG: diacylglycerol kinase [Magnetococcus sp. WYHC-3]